MLSQADRLKIFWASSPQNVRPIPTFEFYHPDFYGSYYYWTEPYVGQVLSESSILLSMAPANINIKFADSDNDLDQNYTFLIDLTDSQDVFRSAMNSVAINSKNEIVIKYREYLSNDLNTIQTSVNLIVSKVSYNQEGAQITACTPRYNLTSSGLIYTPFQIPMLRSFL